VSEVIELDLTIAVSNCVLREAISGRRYLVSWKGVGTRGPEDVVVTVKGLDLEVGRLAVDGEHGLKACPPPTSELAPR
jgi:hypothetical protein